MKRTSLFAALILVFVTPLFAQTAVTPPPQTSGSTSGPALDVTMKFISDKIGDLGTVNYVVYAKDSKTGQTWQNVNFYTITNVRADATTCYVGYHSKGVRDSQIVSDQDSGFFLRDVLDVIIEPETQFFTEQSAAGGNPNVITTATSPTLTALIVRRPHNVINSFPMQDAAMADRLAKALNHAIELCGGGTKEPF
jgi:hypothetical protein